MNHYVYLLIHDQTGLMYIGARSCKGSPEEDSYMSSSSLGKAYCSNCDKLVLATFTTRAEAVSYEIYLHKLFDVGVNPLFFNKSKQTSSKFDTTGTTVVFTESHRRNLSKASKGVPKPHCSGSKNPAARQVRCITTGKVFGTVKEAAAYYNIPSSSNISGTCNGRTRTAGGYEWEYI